MLTRIKEAIKEIKKARRLDEDNRRTSDFLSQRGERIQAIGDFPVNGTLVALVDGINGGFYVLPGKGVFKNRVLPCYNLVTSGSVYTAMVTQDGVADEQWTRTLAEVYMRSIFGDGVLQGGVYKITDAALQQRVQGVLADSSKEVSFVEDLK